MPLRAGTRLGPYEIVAPLGTGGMGEVHRARDSRLNRDVAIKVLPPDVAGDIDRRARFEREAQAVAALSHPNILALFDIGDDGGVLYVVTELLAAETLAERLQQGALPVRRAVEIAIAIARGLLAAHGRNIAHRDLKPANVFLLADGQVKILDFGLARLTGAAPAGATATVAALTDAGLVLGTPGYMAPEQIRGQAVDGRADLFALGVVLYEMLSGQRAFAGESTVEALNAILKEDPPDLARADLPAGLDPDRPALSGEKRGAGPPAVPTAGAVPRTAFERGPRAVAVLAVARRAFPVQRGPRRRPAADCRHHPRLAGAAAPVTRHSCRSRTRERRRRVS
jgi:eukaryotic-like serine/threonine-protein kinase